jgi:hypothetical protein
MGPEATRSVIRKLGFNPYEPCKNCEQGKQIAKGATDMEKTQENKICKAVGCDRQVHSKGYCGGHYYHEITKKKEKSEPRSHHKKQADNARSLASDTKKLLVGRSKALNKELAQGPVLKKGHPDYLKTPVEGHAIAPEDIYGIVKIDFNDYPEVLSRIRIQALTQVRSTEHQIIYFLDQATKDIECPIEP